MQDRVNVLVEKCTTCKYFRGLKSSLVLCGKAGRGIVGCIPAMPRRKDAKRAVECYNYEKNKNR